MKKLLLVMLVPVLVLGVMGCGKVLDADIMPLDLQGSWENTAAELVLVLAGNEATIYSTSNNLRTAAYRVEVTANKDTNGNMSASTGQIKFVGFTDKKAKEIATVEFGFSGTSIEITKVTRADDAVSYLIPELGTYTKTP
jgi:hypothetical protein